VLLIYCRFYIWKRW